MASQTARHAKRSSNQLASLSVMLTSFDVQDAVFDLGFKAVERPGRRASQHGPIFGKQAVMAGAVVLSIGCDPAHAATQVRTDIGDGDEIPAVLRQDIGRDFLLRLDPTSGDL